MSRQKKKKKSKAQELIKYLIVFAVCIFAPIIPLVSGFGTVICTPDNVQMQTIVIQHAWFQNADNQYDAMDRITEVRRSSSPNSQYLAYEYDALGQLVGATDHAAGLEYTYSFDTAGNILSAVKHPTSGGSDSTRTYHFWWLTV